MGFKRDYDGYGDGSGSSSSGGYGGSWTAEIMVVVSVLLVALLFGSCEVEGAQMERVQKEREATPRLELAALVVPTAGLDLHSSIWMKQHGLVEGNRIPWMQSDTGHVASKLVVGGAYVWLIPKAEKSESKTTRRVAKITKWTIPAAFAGAAVANYKRGWGRDEYGRPLVR